MTDESRDPHNSGSSGRSGNSRPVPADIEAEASLLGAALLNKGVLELIAARMTPEDFYLPKHRKIAASLLRLFDRDGVADPVLVAGDLEAHGVSKDELPSSELIKLQIDVASIGNAPRYVERVLEHSQRRRIIEAAYTIGEMGYDLAPDVRDTFLKAQEILGNISTVDELDIRMLERADVGAILRGETNLVEPEILERSDGGALFYAGKMHVLQAEPSTGKTWIALLAAAEVVNKGGAVVYLDYEDTSSGIVKRLGALGVAGDEAAERFVYLSGPSEFNVLARRELDQVLLEVNPDLVIIDGVAEALARDGLDEDKASDVVRWIEKLPRPVARSGAAVIMLDHVVKSKENQGRYARGSSAKLASMDGAAYLVKIVAPFSRTKEGSVKLVIAKDREGGVGEVGGTAAVVSFDPSAAGEIMRAKVDPPLPEGGHGATWKPTHLMAKLYQAVVDSPNPLSSRALKSLHATGDKRYIEEAIARLISEGYLEERREGRSQIIRAVRPYSEHPSTDSPEPPAKPIQQNIIDLEERRKGKENEDT